MCLRVCPGDPCSRWPCEREDIISDRRPGLALSGLGVGGQECTSIPYLGLLPTRQAHLTFPEQIQCRMESPPIPTWVSFPVGLTWISDVPLQGVEV